MVLYPESTEEVSAVLAACNSARVPVIPYGIGTSLEGHVSALHRGICLDMGRMDSILEVSPGAIRYQTLTRFGTA